MKRIIAAIALVFAIGATASAQDYNWGIGIRGGGVANGLTVKGFLDGANALEGMVSFVDGVNIYALYERHVPVIQDGFRFYYGAGGNVGSWREDGDDKFTIGLDGIIGLEYQMPRAPIAFALDYKPNINITGASGFKGWYDVGLGIRVTF